MKEGDELVKQVCRDVAREQGGTNHEMADRRVAEKTPAPQPPASDLDTDEIDNGGMGMAAGENRKRRF